MKRRIRKENKKSKIAQLIIKHIFNNKKQYMIAGTLFLIGMMMGIMFINHTSETQFTEISEYITSIVNTMKDTNKIDYGESLKNSITSNIILVLVMWLAASTLVGIPVVYGTLLLRGFALGYTISSVLATLGTGTGILFSIASFIFHNLIFIPVLLALSVSGMNLYDSIIKNRNRENVKLEFIRHTAFCLIMFVWLLLSAIIETYISINLGKLIVTNIKV